MKRFLVRSLILLACVAIAAAFWYFKVRSLIRQQGSPSSQEVLFSRVGDADRQILRDVFLVMNLRSGMRATGFLVSSGPIVTDAHVVAGARPADLDVFGADGRKVVLKGLEVDPGLDVAFLRPEVALSGGADLEEPASAGPGDQVYTWGYPSNMAPPLPLMAMGYVAGYREVRGQPGQEPAIRMVLGGSFTEGNAGGPLFRWKDSALVGLVVTRPAAEDPFVARALKALGDAEPGQKLEIVDEQGRRVSLTRDELLARVLPRLRAVGPQVVEAIPLDALKARLADMKRGFSPFSF